jgi:hypothetical protein
MLWNHVPHQSGLIRPLISVRGLASVSLLAVLVFMKLYNRDPRQVFIAACSTHRICW